MFFEDVARTFIHMRWAYPMLMIAKQKGRLVEPSCQFWGRERVEMYLGMNPDEQVVNTFVSF